MNEQQKRVLNDWTPMLKNCLVPSSLCDHITDFMIGTEAHDEIFNSAGATLETSIFIDILLASTTENIYDQFVLSLMKSEDQVWLAPIFDDRFSLDDRDNALIYSTQMAKIYMNFRNWLKQGKINISVGVVLENCILTKKENEEVQALLGTHGQGRAVRFIIGRLIRKGPGVLEDFYNALKEANIQFAETLFPLIEELKKNSEEVESLSTKMKKMSLDDKDEISTNVICHSGDATAPKLLQAEVVPNPPDEQSVPKNPKAFVNDEDKSGDDQSSDNNVSSTSTCKPKVDSNDSSENEDSKNCDDSGESDEDDIETDEEENKAVFRDYQEELAEQAKKGENSLIVAPTGTGKTFVALCVCLDHLQKKGKEAKIIFMVPKVPLIKQQHDTLSRYIKKFKVKKISGKSPEIPVSNLIRDCQIAVITPQKLVDHLESYENRKKKKKDLLKIQELTLLIFDECHHVTKGDPFNKIMNCYFDEKEKKMKEKQNSGKELPQILGLTASPGIGPAKTFQIAEDSLKTLLGNLDVVTPPKRVVRCIERLREMESEECSETYPIKRRKKDKFENDIKNIMNEIEALIRKELSKNKDCKLKFNDKDQGSQVYEATVVKFHNDSAIIDNKVLGEKLMKYSNHLRGYNNSLHLNDHVRSIDAIKDIEKALFSEMNEKNTVDIKLKKLYTAHIHEPALKNTNPLLSKLRSILIEEFGKKLEPLAEASRCIIFVKTRPIADGLVSFITASKNLAKYKLNPYCFTGANAKDANYGNTKAAQDQKIKAFREGRCKILVATSVAEEGLDIPDCNLIITYNHSTNEIGLVQRKGRARAKNSKTVMLAYDDSDIIKREDINKLRVELTNEIMDKLDSKDPVELRKEIEMIQKTKFNERDLEREASSRMVVEKPEASDIKWVFKCKICSERVTTSDKFRHIDNNLYFVIDPEFNTKALFENDKKEKVLLAKNQQFIGKIYCGVETCRHPWGERTKYKSFYISVLKITSFKLVNEIEKPPKTPKQWKDVPFIVTKYDSGEELKEMMPQS